MSEGSFDEYAPRGSPALRVDLKRALARRWRWMLALVVAGALVSLGVWLWMPARYFAEAVILVAPQKVSENLVEPTLRDDALSQIDSLAAEVLSARNVARLIEEFDLYPELRDEETMAEIVDRVRQDISITPSLPLNRQLRQVTSPVYSIGVEAATPTAAAGVANQLATLFVDTSLAERHRQHQLTTEFLRRELQKAEDELREQNREIAEFKREHRGTLPSDLQASMARLDLLQNKRQSLALQIAEAGTRVAMLAGSADATPVGQVELMRSRLRELRISHTERHPDVLALEAKIAELERQQGATAGATGVTSRSELLSAAEATIGVLQRQLAETEGELAAIDQRIGSIPAVQEKQASLEERVVILRENYLEFLRKVHNAQLSEDLLKAQQGERLSIVNQAEPPSKPRNTPWRYLAIGLAGTLAAAVLLGFVLERLDPVLDSVAQIEEITTIPVLGWAPRIR